MSLKALLNIQPGEVVCYWTARPGRNIPIDSAIREGDTDAEQTHARECATVARAAMKLYHEGRVELVQRRTRTNEHFGVTEYLAIGRRNIEPPVES